MPAYPHLFEEKVDGEEIQAHMKALKLIGVPYSDEEIAKAPELVKGMTKGDALVAYLLKLGRDQKK
jgi:cytochrome c oxidase cbb3-type subunit 2